MEMLRNVRLKRAGGDIAVNRQVGASLMEMMIGLALSLVVVTSMVALMSNSVGSATRITQMSQLTDELRNTMSMLSRDIRRANYNANAIYCYGNSRCGEDDMSAEQSADLDFDGSGGSCVIFGLDRNFDGDASTDDAGAFRRREVDNDSGQRVGQVEMWVGGNAPDCDQNINNTDPDIPGDWIAITDPGFVDILEFNVDDSEVNAGTYENRVLEEDESELVQRVRFVLLEIEGRLNLDNSIQRRVVDTIRLRNDFYDHE